MSKNKSFSSNRDMLQRLVVLALLVAANVVVSRFLTIQTESLKLGFSFILVAFAAREYGVLGGAVVGGLGDFVGAILFPFGPYFFGFTFTAILCGSVFGIFLRQKKIWRVAVAVLINEFLLGALLNTLWISILYGSPYFSLLPLRLIQAAILSAVSIPAICILNDHLPKIKRTS